MDEVGIYLVMISVLFYMSCLQRQSVCVQKYLDRNKADEHAVHNLRSHVLWGTMLSIITCRLICKKKSTQVHEGNENLF